jgi:hypothetical protein
MLTLWLFIEIKQHVTVKVNANIWSYQNIYVIVVSNIILHKEYYKKCAEFHVYFFLCSASHIKCNFTVKIMWVERNNNHILSHTCRHDVSENLTFMVPCIMMYLTKMTNKMQLHRITYCSLKLYMFRAKLLLIIRSITTVFTASGIIHVYGCWLVWWIS